MESLERIRDNLVKSEARVLARVEATGIVACL
jgi:hypothetical protein